MPAVSAHQDQGWPIDLLSHVFPEDRGEQYFSQFKSDVWSTRRYPQPLFAF